MGKRIAVCMILLLLMAPVVVVAASEVSVAVDGVLVGFEDARPFEYYGQILAPVRPVFERMGFYFDWVGAGEREIVMMHRHDFAIQIVLGELTFTINGMTRPLYVAAWRLDGEVMVPISVLAESIGKTVAWDDISRVLFISSPVAQHMPPSGLPHGLDFIPSGPPAGFGESTAPGDVVVMPPVVHVPVVIHTVEAGENLSRIARQHYPQLNHDDHRVHTEAIDQIVRDNPIIRDRNRIRVGWELRIYPFGTVPVPVPTAEDIARAQAAREFPHLPVEHLIQPGENLSLIAIRYFPTLNLDRDVDLRLSVIAQIASDNEIANPHLIAAGTYITINPFVRR